MQGRHRDGSLFPLDLSASLFRLAGRRHFTAIVRDITERTRVERDLSKYAQVLESTNRALAAAKLEAEMANRFMSEFLASMSHEIRTPMTAILGFSEVLSGVLSNPEHVEIAETIKRNGEHLVRIVNDILNLAKIEAGKVALEVGPCSPRQLVGDIHSSLSRLAEQQGMSFAAECTQSVPENILCDTTRLRQILFNLAGNAIKSTEHGSVWVDVQCVADPSGQQLEFAVSDTGFGMTEEQLRRLFEPFAQLHRTSDQRQRGTGLGLAISQRLAELLGGQITVTSRSGHGSTFVLRMPLVPDEGSAAAKLEQVASALASSVQAIQLECHVLLAEDGRDNQMPISRMLEGAGASVRVVSDGQQAIDEFETSMTSGKPFAAVLMDAQMSVLDGSDATRELRARGHRVPIVALTASAMKGDREHCLALGCTDYLAKPIDRQLLIETVARWGAKGEPPQSAPPPPK